MIKIIHICLFFKKAYIEYDCLGEIISFIQLAEKGMLYLSLNRDN